MPCRLLDCYHVSEGLTASIISVCLPHLFAAGSWSSVVRKTGTYLPNFLPPSVIQTDASVSYTGFQVTYFLLTNLHKWTEFCYSFPYLPHNFISCMHFTLLFKNPLKLSLYLYFVVFLVTKLVETYTLKMEVVCSSETFQSLVFFIGCTELQNLK